MLLFRFKRYIVFRLKTKGESLKINGYKHIFGKEFTSFINCMTTFSLQPGPIISNYKMTLHRSSAIFHNHYCIEYKTSNFISRMRTPIDANFDIDFYIDNRDNELIYTYKYDNQKLIWQCTALKYFSNNDDSYSTIMYKMKQFDKYFMYGYYSGIKNMYIFKIIQYEQLNIDDIDMYNFPFPHNAMFIIYNNNGKIIKFVHIHDASRRLQCQKRHYINVN